MAAIMHMLRMRRRVRANLHHVVDAVAEAVAEDIEMGRDVAQRAQAAVVNLMDVSADEQDGEGGAEAPLMQARERKVSYKMPFNNFYFLSITFSGHFCNIFCLSLGFVYLKMGFTRRKKLK